VTEKQMLKPGERLTWTSAEGRSVVLARTDAGQTWTVELRNTAGLTDGDLLVCEDEDTARAKARFIAEYIRDYETIEVTA
jgi:hypothetical protein